MGHHPKCLIKYLDSFFSVALPFLGLQRPLLGPLLAEGKGKKRVMCGRVSWAMCFA